MIHNVVFFCFYSIFIFRDIYGFLYEKVDDFDFGDL